MTLGRPQRRDYHSFSIFTFAGRELEVKSETIRHNLPTLWYLASNARKTRHIKTEKFLRPGLHYEAAAVDAIFRYLREYDRNHGISSAISDAFNSVWRYSQHSGKAPQELFYGLGEIFLVFGFSSKILSIMASMFVKHSDEIMHSSRARWVPYVQILDQMSEDSGSDRIMEEVVTTVLQNTQFNRRDVDGLRHDRMLSGSTLDLFARLINQKQQRRDRLALESKRHHGLEVSHYPHKRDRHNGRDYHPKDLKNLAAYQPDRVEVRFPHRGLHTSHHGFDSGDLGLDFFDDFSDDEDDLFGDYYDPCDMRIAMLPFGPYGNPGMPETDRYAFARRGPKRINM